MHPNNIDSDIDLAMITVLGCVSCTIVAGIGFIIGEDYGFPILETIFSFAV